MEFYKTETGLVYAYSDDQIKAGFVAAGLVKMTADEVELHCNPPVSPEELTEEAKGQQLALRLAADSEIEWRQDAVDTGIATDEETALLSAWKTYRVQLMRVDISKAPDIEWPATPSE